MRNKVIYLVNVVFTQDEIKQTVRTETLKQVFAGVESVGQSEWQACGQQGLKPECRFIVFEHEYSGQDEVIYDSVRYRIYRTYKRDNEEIELYAERITE